MISNLTSHLVPIDQVWVNRAFIGMDEDKPYQEAVGTLIHTMSHGLVIKVSETAVKVVSLEEAADWDGPVAPLWAIKR